VFGPDGNLYVNSFRANANDTDSIRIYNGPASPSPGGFSTAIVLDVVGQPRVFADGLLFGPDGKLFVPVTGNDPSHTGEVRSYDVATAGYPFTTVVRIGTLKAPFFLTFGRTNSATLAYGD